MNIYSSIIWLTIFMIFINIKDRKIKYRANKEKVKTVLIILIFYYIIYFFLGLKFGYSNSPYSLKISEIVKNLFYILGIKLIQEYIRNKIVNYKRTYINYVIITIIFAIVNIEFQKVLNGEEFIKFIFIEIVPIFIQSSLLTFLTLSGGIKLAYSYIIPVNLITIIAPIFPNLNWYIDLILKFLMFLLIFLFVSYENIIRISKKSRKEIESESPIKSLPIIFLVIILACFVIGIFPYKPVAVISNSMYPEFARGSVLIIKTYNQDEIKVNDIIEYELNGNLIVHRVVGVEKEIFENYYITKGDNNPNADLLPVAQSQIRGIVKFKIPYLGYPSVLFSEILLNR